MKPHFEAKICIFTAEEGGRIRPAHNGIRWDLVYVENNPSGTVYMIWPDFIDDQGESLDKGLFLEGTLSAQMSIVIEDMIPFHRNRIQIGTEFYCVEGPNKVAKGIVTKTMFDTGIE